MINGAHVVISSFDPDADHVFFQNSGGVAFHPAEENNRYELYLMCDDLQAEMAALRAKGANAAK